MVVLTEEMVLEKARASSLADVVNLNLWGSRISNMDLLEEMPNIKVLSLSVNSIRSLACFACCAKLEELFLRKNKIETLAELAHLRGLEHLRVLWLSDNPCAKEKNYRATVLRTLPNLKKLDNITVTDEEVEEAKTLGSDIGAPAAQENLPPAAVAAAPSASSPLRAVESAVNVPPGSPAAAAVPSSKKEQAILQSVLSLLAVMDRSSLKTVAAHVRDLLVQQPAP